MNRSSSMYAKSNLGVQVFTEDVRRDRRVRERWEASHGSGGEVSTFVGSTREVQSLCMCDNADTTVTLLGETATVVAGASANDVKMAMEDVTPRLVVACFGMCCGYFVFAAELIQQLLEVSGAT